MTEANAMKQPPPAPTATIRRATRQDASLLLTLIKELADYERLSHMVVATEADIREALFGPRPVAEALVAEWDAQPAGFALFFRNFSTFLGRPGIYLEDMYVRPAMRKKGIGRTMLARIARLAKQRNCARMEWAVLDWNEPARQFYRSLGAQELDDWTVWRLTGKGLDDLAARSPQEPRPARP